MGIDGGGAREGGIEMAIEAGHIDRMGGREGKEREKEEREEHNKIEEKRNIKTTEGMCLFKDEPSHPKSILSIIPYPKKKTNPKQNPRP
jgi:hypothetical protein